MFNLGRHIPQLFGNYFVVDSQKKATYQFAHWLFGRALGLVSVIAFLSYWSQADALIGDDGIKPWKEDLQFIEELTAVQENPAKGKRNQLLPSFVLVVSMRN